jgi:hypothetical protein
MARSSAPSAAPDLALVLRPRPAAPRSAQGEAPVSWSSRELTGYAARGYGLCAGARLLADHLDATKLEPEHLTGIRLCDVLRSEWAVTPSGRTGQLHRKSPGKRGFSDRGAEI